jgi:hypothetical protein
MTAYHLIHRVALARSGETLLVHGAAIAPGAGGAPRPPCFRGSIHL